MAKRVRVEGILLGSPGNQNSVQRVSFRSGNTTRIIDVTIADVGPMREPVPDWGWACKQMLKGKTVQGPYDEGCYIEDRYIRDKDGICAISEVMLEYPAWTVVKGN